MEFNLYTITRKNIFSRTHIIYSGDEPVYQSKFSFFLRRCVLTDMSGQEVFIIKRKFAAFQSIFEIIYQGVTFARIKAKGAIKTKLLVDTEDGPYLVVGKSFFKEFTVIKNDEEIAKISRKTSLKTNIGLAIREGEDDEFILALIMVIEIVIRLKRAKSG